MRPRAFGYMKAIPAWTHQPGRAQHLPDTRVAELLSLQGPSDVPGTKKAEGLVKNMERGFGQRSVGTGQAEMALT